MKYKLSPKGLRQITEIEKWQHGDKFLIITKRWRSGYLVLSEKPVFSELYSPKIGIDVNAEFDPLHHAFKGCETYYEYRNIGLDERQLIEKIYADSMAEGLQILGWKNLKFQCWFYGDLKLEELE